MFWVTACQRGHANPLIVIRACFHAPPPPHLLLCKCVQVCPHLRLHSFRGGVSGIKERVFAYAACCLQEREQSKKDVRGGQRERGQILHCGLGVRKRARLNWGVGENWQRKSSAWFPVGIKALRSLHAYSLKMGEKNNMQSAGGDFLFFLTRHEKEVCCSKKNAAFDFVQNF